MTQPTPGLEQGLTTLLARVKAATGPDREIDVEIGAVTEQPIESMGIPFRDYCDIYGRDWPKIAHQAESHQNILSHGLPRYTASIDASLALVERMLPGSMKRVFDNPDDGSTRAEIVSDLIYGKGDHDTWPLAILTALLSALKEVR